MNGLLHAASSMQASRVYQEVKSPCSVLSLCAPPPWDQPGPNRASNGPGHGSEALSARTAPPGCVPTALHRKEPGEVGGL